MQNASDPVSALAARVGQSLADAIARAAGVPTTLSSWRAVRSTWGQVRPTLSSAAAGSSLPGVPGGVVVEPDPNLAANSPLARVATAAIRSALMPAARGTGAGEPDRARLPDDLGVLVVAYELRQPTAAWRLRVCLPVNTLSALLASAPPSEPPPVAELDIDAGRPDQTLMREVAKVDPKTLADLIRRLMAQDDS